MIKFIAYFRVSTERQGKSGLGLAAQHRKISDFVAGAGTLIAEFCDVQSGRDDSRVELQRAIQLARRENATIVIARLDRFSRRVSFIANILDQGIRLVCAEMPNATDFQLHIFAALAQEERRLISERTKAALVEAKRRGKILGANGRNLAARNRKAADDFASQLRANLDADLMGRSYSEIARQLNEAGVMTVTGRRFYPQTVKNYLIVAGDELGNPLGFSNVTIVVPSLPKPMLAKKGGAYLPSTPTAAAIGETWKEIAFNGRADLVMVQRASKFNFKL